MQEVPNPLLPGRKQHVWEARAGERRRTVLWQSNQIKFRTFIKKKFICHKIIIITKNYTTGNF